jgi:hypothetical protein
MKVFPWSGHSKLEDLPREDIWMSKKIVVSLLSITLMAALITATANPSSVMAIVGLSSLDARSLDQAKADYVKALNTGLTDLASEMGKSTKETYSSDDEAVKISASKTEKEVTVDIYVDASKIPEFNYKDVGKVMKVAQEYLSSAFTDKQAAALCGLLVGDAYVQYRKGNEKINISKNYDGLTITCTGNIKTGLTVLTLKSTLGVKKCLPNKSKIMEMKASLL